MDKDATKRRFILSTGGVEKFDKVKISSVLFLFVQHTVTLSGDYCPNTVPRATAVLWTDSLQ